MRVQLNAQTAAKLQAIQAKLDLTHASQAISVLVGLYGDRLLAGEDPQVVGERTPTQPHRASLSVIEGRAATERPQPTTQEPGGNDFIDDPVLNRLAGVLTTEF